MQKTIVLTFFSRRLLHQSDPLSQFESYGRLYSPTMRNFLSKSLTLGLIVREFTSVEPLGKLRAPLTSFEMVMKPTESGSFAKRFIDATQLDTTALVQHAHATSR